MTLTSIYFEIFCDVPKCASVLRVPATVHDPAKSLAQRALEHLLAEGWTEDAEGRNQCPLHSPTNSL